MISKEGLHPLSFICSGSEPFRLEEQLLSVEGEIFLLTGIVGKTQDKESNSQTNHAQLRMTYDEVQSQLNLVKTMNKTLRRRVIALKRTKCITIRRSLRRNISHAQPDV